MKYFYQLLFVFGIVFCFSRLQVHAAQIPLPVLIIQQIRGNETCCEPGSADMVDKISKMPESTTLKLAWALRFDALKNEQLIATLSALPKNHSLGLLLEITPQLASASGVIYHGDLQGSDWHSARNAFLLGYTQVERKKLIDTLFAEFKKHFGYFPKLTVAWMIDSWSLNYLVQTYHIKLHELTKEQYETDTYTLYGGIFNRGYFPSQNHPLIPTASGLDVVMVRQTVSDILRNYGSYHSDYTSQPNDYLQNPQGLDFEYFKKLLTESSSQNPPNQLAVLGLENSREWQQFQAEYVKQLHYISAGEQAGSIKTVTPEAAYDFYKQQPLNTAKYIKTTDFPKSGVLNYFSNNYRARLEVIDGKLNLTDLHIYGAFEDPYAAVPATQNHAYWVVPYVLDSSQQFNVVDDRIMRYKGNPIRSDDGVKRFVFELSDQPFTKVTDEGETIILENVSGIKIRLEPEKIRLEHSAGFTFGAPINLSTNQLLDTTADLFFTFRAHPRFFMSPDKTQQKLTIGWENSKSEKVIMATIIKNNDNWELVPNTKLTQGEVDSLAMIFQPDKTPLPFEIASSVIYWNNTTALANRNPVRLLIDPRNHLSRRVPISTIEAHISNPQIKVQLPTNVATKMEPLFLDFTASQSAEGEVSLIIDGNIVAEKTKVIFFADCLHNFNTCIKQPEQLLAYIRSYLQEQIQKFRQLIK
jgi:hypothetical protein